MHLDSARLGRVAADEALALERLELGVDAGGRGQADRVADLTDRRGVASVGDRVADHLQDASLPGGELLRHRCTP
jgi:hypothetical protein